MGGGPLDKAPDAFRTISEVADDLDVPQHVLRFWETRFAQIKPMKRCGGRRYYRPEDVDLLRGIRHLLYGQGYTIRGVQRILREQGIKTVQNWQTGAISPMVPAEDDEPDHEEMLRTAVSEEMSDDFDAGDGDDVGEASSHELPSARSRPSSTPRAITAHRRRRAWPTACRRSRISTSATSPNCASRWTSCWNAAACSMPR